MRSPIRQTVERQEEPRPAVVGLTVTTILTDKGDPGFWREGLKKLLRGQAISLACDVWVSDNEICPLWALLRIYRRYAVV